MKKYRYLMIGGGLASDAAVVGIRAVDPDGDIGLLCAETHPPYRRPMLSKALWQGASLDAVRLETEAAGATLHLGCIVSHLDLTHKEAHDQHGKIYRFDKLLIATGCRPIRLPNTSDTDELIYFRTLDDYTRLRAMCQWKQRFAVIGGGYIGSEIAAALTNEGKQVMMLFPEAGIGARLFPEELALYLNDYYRQRGVEVHAGEWVETIRSAGNGEWMVGSRSGKKWQVQAIVAGLGVQPDDELAKHAGIETNDGIPVNEYLQASHSDIYAAGDVANFYHATLRRRMRVEHEDNAIAMGFYAGQNMAGEALSYEHSPSFYSQLFDHHYQAVGVIDAGADIESKWQEPFHTGMLYYLKEDIVQGVLLWGMIDKVEEARELLGTPYSSRR
jgi:3-phenylpropionate/trans-cinnamate dioxygenase ferredoxin reductase subunit